MQCIILQSDLGLDLGWSATQMHAKKRPTHKQTCRQRVTGIGRKEGRKRETATATARQRQIKRQGQSEPDRERERREERESREKET